MIGSSLMVRLPKTAMLVLGALALLMPACADGEENGPGGTEACDAVCDAQEAGMCGLLSTDDCKQICGAFSQAPASCQAAVDAYYQCVLDNEIACDAANDACDSELATYQAACES